MGRNWARSFDQRRPRLDAGDLADRLHCSRSAGSRLETGAQPLDGFAALRRLAEVLRISTTALEITATVTVQPSAEDDCGAVTS
ncbi:helix-turn-helix domain-containing protein [Spirillospora sp. CA-142024]|uniref:helix-turn-helix domain-containing protein n=1 Tax=Spirillospora sp. CA-142024 TaxID=3240036 RepID=UPI003D8D024B